MSIEILELPEVRERLLRYSVEVYEQMPERDAQGRRTELIRGIIIQKMPKSPLHASISKRLYDRVLALTPEGFTVRADQPLRLIDSMPEPDVTVARGKDSEFWEQHPRTAELAIEVAVSTLSLDRANAALYAENGVREYWIVIPRQRCVEVYRDPHNGEYREKHIFSDEQTLACEGIPAIALNVADIFTP